MKIFSRIRLAFCALALVPVCARGVQVAGSDGLDHFSNPGDGTPWANVGAIGALSAVYLGSYSTGYWVISAAHVAGNGDGLSVNLGGVSYAIVAGSGVRLRNADNSVADLVMFRLGADPGLANLTVNAGALSAGTGVRMIGNGAGRAADLSYWSLDTSGANWVWTSLPDSVGADAAGYLWTGAHALSWGDNTVQASGLSVNVGFGATSVFSTVFDAYVGESQAATGDSGGGVFARTVEGDWVLVGVLDAIGTLNSQPANTSVFGDATYSADLAAYHGQISQLLAIPEPATYGVSAGVAALALAAIRRRRRAA